MKLQITEDFDKKLTELYLSKVTVNLDSESTVSADSIYNSMELIAVNRRAMINFQIAR